MRRQVFSLLTIVALLIVPVFALATSINIAGAETSVEVKINATPSWVSINTSETTFDFGTVEAGATNTTENTTTDWCDIGNEGSVEINCTVKCDNWTHTSGSSDWTYDFPVGADTGYLNFSAGTGLYDTKVPDSSETAVVMLEALASLATDSFELGLFAPSSYTHGDAQQTNLTITGVATGG